LEDALTRTFSGIFSLLFTLVPSLPPLSLKTITTGSFSPEAVAAKATVNPFFSALVFSILMVLSWNSIVMVPCQTDTLFDPL